MRVMTCWNTTSNDVPAFNIYMREWACVSAVRTGIVSYSVLPCIKFLKDVIVIYITKGYILITSGIIRLRLS
ncbi:hypothetical protein H5410_060314 [Solanum commersonii]|uniref:Uncharacterized protein n=1 Tax=Solanum commersonii TaxID=4109 RepID=A0A9J5W5N2_SOLCO|nr:hypothetical protein H5410_060314 [Solanum commersonii]